MNVNFGVPLTSTIVATHTKVYSWPTTSNISFEVDNSIPASVRIVSNVPVSAELSHHLTTADWQVVVCTPQQP
jgi:hypothetical protein